MKEMHRHVLLVSAVWQIIKVHRKKHSCKLSLYSIDMMHIQNKYVYFGVFNNQSLCYSTDQKKCTLRSGVTPRKSKMHVEDCVASCGNMIIHQHYNSLWLITQHFHSDLSKSSLALLTGHFVRRKYRIVGHVDILSGCCPLTDHYICLWHLKIRI